MQSSAESKRQKTEGVLLDAEDLAFLADSTAPSPAISEQSSHIPMIGGAIDDDSSNEALVVDCESPSSSSTPGEWNLISFGKSFCSMEVKVLKICHKECQEQHKIPPIIKQ